MKSVYRTTLIAITIVSLSCILIVFLGKPTVVAPVSHEAVTKVVVEKEKRLLTLFANDTPVASYKISLGRSPFGDKRMEGDGKTPEGDYLLDYRNPRSSFHLSMHISYPDSNDQNRARAGGNDPGGMIMVHGLRNGLGWLGKFHTMLDWTNGCIAITNQEMDQFWEIVPDSTPISILP